MEQNRILPQADQRVRRVSEQFGHAVQLLFDTGQGKFSVAAAHTWILPAVLHRQICFAFNRDGCPIAYISWAYVSDETLQRLQKDDVMALDPSEWNEGLNLWIVDFVAVKRMAPFVARFFRRELRLHGDYLHGMKRKADGSVRRLVTLPLRNLTSGKTKDAA